MVWKCGRFEVNQVTQINGRWIELDTIISEADDQDIRKLTRSLVTVTSLSKHGHGTKASLPSEVWSMVGIVPKWGVGRNGESWCQGKIGAMDIVECGASSAESQGRAEVTLVCDLAASHVTNAQAYLHSR